MWPWKVFWTGLAQWSIVLGFIVFSILLVSFIIFLFDI